MQYERINELVKTRQITTETYGALLHSFMHSELPEEEYSGMPDEQVFAKILMECFGYKEQNISMDEIVLRMIADMQEEIEEAGGEEAFAKNYDEEVRPIHKDGELNPLFVRAWVYDNCPISNYDYKA